MTFYFLCRHARPPSHSRQCPSTLPSGLIPIFPAAANISFHHTLIKAPLPHTPPSLRRFSVRHSIDTVLTVPILQFSCCLNCAILFDSFQLRLDQTSPLPYHEERSPPAASLVLGTRIFSSPVCRITQVCRMKFEKTT